MSRGRARRKSNKKTVTIAVLAACLLLAAIGGTIAWLTAKDSLTNQFTVGDFKDPTTDPTNPGEEIPEDDKDPEAGKLNGHLYEPNWDKENNKLVPGGTLAKDPYVGIGKGSESAVVYVYVKNTATTEGNLYFKLNAGWEAVGANHFIPGENDPGYETGANYYSSGLFKYTAGLTAVADKDQWTSMPVFSKVFVANGATSEGLAPAVGNDVTCLKVTALLHQKMSGDGTPINDSEISSWVNKQVEELKAETVTEAP